jgi:hypothetical protein
MADIAVFMGDAETVTGANLYECCARLWKANDGIDAAFLAVDALMYLLDHPAITRMGTELGLVVRKQKMGAAFDIVALMWKVWTVGRNVRAVAAITALQKRWRAAHTDVNATDPFTLEEIADISPERVFRVAEKGRIYAFDGPSLYEHVHIHRNPVNPLTRERLDGAVIVRLAKRFLATAPTTVEWSSPSVAFTDVAAELERIHGIVIQPAWLTALLRSDIFAIYGEYHHLTAHLGTYMLATDTEQFHFAHEMLRMIHHEPAPSFDVCCLAVAIANFCEPLRDTLPDWVWDAAVQ